MNLLSELKPWVLDVAASPLSTMPCLDTAYLLPELQQQTSSSIIYIKQERVQNKQQKPKTRIKESGAEKVG